MLRIESVSESADSPTGYTTVEGDNISAAEILTLYCNITERIALALSEAPGSTAELAANLVRHAADRAVHVFLEENTYDPN